MPWLAAAAGIGSMIGGGVLAGNAAKMAQKNMLAAANLPGVNLQDTGTEALSSQQALLSQARSIAGQVNQFQNQQLQNIIESSMPGEMQRRQTQGQDIEAYLRGDVPEDVKNLLKTNAAEAAVARGMPGSSGLSGSLSSNDWLRNLGLTSLGVINTGMAAENAFRSSVPYIGPMDITSELGPTPTQDVQLREQERLAKQALLARKAGMPGQTASWANTLSQMGGTLLGAGLAGMGGGMGGITAPSGFGGANKTGTTVGDVVQNRLFMDQFYGNPGAVPTS